MNQWKSKIEIHSGGAYLGYFTLVMQREACGAEKMAEYTRKQVDALKGKDFKIADITDVISLID